MEKTRAARPVLIHGQTLRRDQIPQLKDLGIFPSLFPMHTFYWGDWHRDSVLGDPRAQNISPTGWVLQQGMRFTSHHDAPVALPSSIRVLDATVNRVTRTGKVLGPEHRVSPGLRCRPRRCGRLTSILKMTARARWRSASWPIW